MNKPHNFLLTLRVDGKIIASRNLELIEYNDNVIYSLRINEIMKDMVSLIEEGMKDNSIEKAHRLVEDGKWGGDK
jgi:hypothetical protein